MTPSPSISIEKAAALLEITTEELTALCDRDTHHRYHHRTIYTNLIRFFDSDIQKIRKRPPQLKKGNVPVDHHAN